MREKTLKYSIPAGLLVLSGSFIMQRYLKPADFISGFMIGIAIAIMLLPFIFNKVRSSR